MMMHDLALGASFGGLSPSRPASSATCGAGPSFALRCARLRWCADESGRVAGTRLRRSGERGVLQPVGRRRRVRLRREVPVVVVRPPQQLQQPLDLTVVAALRLLDGLG